MAAKIRNSSFSAPFVSRPPILALRIVGAYKLLEKTIFAHCKQASPSFYSLFHN